MRGEGRADVSPKNKSRPHTRAGHGAVPPAHTRGFGAGAIRAGHGAVPVTHTLAGSETHTLAGGRLCPVPGACSWLVGFSTRDRAWARTLA